MKYILFETECNGIVRHVPFIFPPEVPHVSMFNAVNDNEHFEHLRSLGYTVKLISAGDYDVVECKTSGRSSTLGLDSRPEDGDTILKYVYFHGIQI